MRFLHFLIVAVLLASFMESGAMPRNPKKKRGWDTPAPCRYCQWNGPQCCVYYCSSCNYEEAREEGHYVSSHLLERQGR
uniref:Conotoxin Cal6.3a n=1 Tax=Californiconus californicus TaxID=1736779 RepID=U63A_CONCL|nr:RecName: Full=Conotoxin Cal6.3a; Flags: Precursor [Californiconus californicus]ADB04236.1 conotoxin Cal 6.3a precursor [Californiconus californicus]